MLRFNHERTIRLKFSFESGVSICVAVHTDEEILDFFNRNHVRLPKENEWVSPQICIKRILEFLGKNKFDQSINEVAYGQTLVIKIKLHKRSERPHYN
jgi:hypothetical protein